MFRQALRHATKRRRRTPRRVASNRTSARVLLSTNTSDGGAVSSPYNVGTLHPSMTSGSVTVAEPPFKKLMAGNRGEIATRICRGASELGVQTVGIYSHEGTNFLAFRLLSGM